MKLSQRPVILALILLAAQTSPQDGFLLSNKTTTRKISKVTTNKREATIKTLNSDALQVKSISSSRQDPLHLFSGTKEVAAESVATKSKFALVKDKVKSVGSKGVEAVRPACDSIVTITKSHPYATGVAAAVVLGIGAKAYFDRPSRTYGDGTVAKEYDAWTQDGILEYYWGEHIHLGFYSKDEMENGYKKKDFKQAKYDFVDEMMKLGGINPASDSEAKVLDVGCGFGGTSRYLAKNLGPKSSVTGITLSPKQVERGTELAKEQGIDNVEFRVMDALDMDYEDNTFDVVWACESGEHMPDKKKYIEEMMRVLKPGGKFVMATWCQRDDREKPFTDKDERDLKFLYEEWTHPYFISIEAYKELMEGTGLLDESTIVTDDWNEQTIASWRHSIWVGVYDPRGFIFKPTKYIKCLRDAYCLERMHRAFDRGLMQYGMFAARKSLSAPSSSSSQTSSEQSNSGLGEAYSKATKDQYEGSKSPSGGNLSLNTVGPYK